MMVPQTRTNFYKLPLKELEERIERLNEWVMKNGKKHTDFELVYRSLVEATNMYECQTAIIADPKGTRQLQDVLEVFWGGVPLKYDPSKVGEPPAETLTY